MAKRTFKYRRYPKLSQISKLQIECSKLQIKDLDAYAFEEETCDTSIGGASKSSVWLTGRNFYDDNEYELFLHQKESEFVEILLTEDFSDSVVNDSTAYLNRLRKGHKNKITKWIETLYINHQNEEFFIMQMFRLFRCFPFDYLYPSSLVLAGLGIHHQSDFVKSEAISLLDHWGNADVFNHLCNHEPPETPWLRTKYNAVKKSLERYAAN